MNEGEWNNNFLELFSGIGGLRMGFRKYIKSCTSYDMNENANQVYKLNFGESPKNNSITSLNEKDVMGFGTWLLSPNCQPFTRGGNELDDQDYRTKPFLKIIELLHNLKSNPRRIFVENVAQFYGSRTYVRLRDVLLSKGYTIQPIITSPHQIGIPNRRVRCYILAWQDTPIELDVIEGPLDSDVRAVINLRSFIGNDDLGDLVQKAWLLKYPNYRFDVVSLDCNHSSTFTKSYGSKHLKGSGSLLGDYCTHLCGNDSGIEHTINSNPRFMSPEQLLLIAGFPRSFDMGNSLTTKQKCALIGNSVNVKVIEYLADFIFTK